MAFARSQFWATNACYILGRRSFAPRLDGDRLLCYHIVMAFVRSQFWTTNVYSTLGQQSFGPGMDGDRSLSCAIRDGVRTLPVLDDEDLLHSWTAIVCTVIAS